MADTSTRRFPKLSEMNRLFRNGFTAEDLRRMARADKPTRPPPPQAHRTSPPPSASPPEHGSHDGPSPNPCCSQGLASDGVGCDSSTRHDVPQQQQPSSADHHIMATPSMMVHTPFLGTYIKSPAQLSFSTLATLIAFLQPSTRLDQPTFKLTLQTRTSDEYEVWKCGWAQRSYMAGRVIYDEDSWRAFITEVTEEVKAGGTAGVDIVAVLLE
ncbi:hypothetical protein DFH27DRAFT_581449 [Peziza echinospora]|nr:hypothetical protein DFH27DRAFT_581449 [Peziza echinospora]